MAIQLHNLITSCQRYIQVESQPHHITGIFLKITQYTGVNTYNISQRVRGCYECEEDGTITFYQRNILNSGDSGIWTYLVYDCPEGEEKVLRDSSLDTNISLLEELLEGRKITQTSVNIYEYLRQKYQQKEYIDVQLPSSWNHEEGTKIANLLLEEYKALKSLSIFSETAGKEYTDAVLNGFVKAALEVMKTRGTAKDFESAQYNVLDKIKIADVANLILEHNDYRIWQAALPSKSKAVECVFNNALILICQN